jgi:hypothetical protein
MTDSGRVTGDEALLAELIRGVKLVDAARAAGMPERTARRRDRHRATQPLCVSQAAGRLALGAEDNKSSPEPPAPAL